MAEIAKINKVNIYQESLGKDINGDPTLSYTEVGQASIGTDIDIGNINTGNIILQDITDYSDGATHFGVSNGVSIDGDKLIANTVETTDLILGTKNIKDTALKEVKLTSSDGEDGSINLTITGMTLNGNEVVSKEAAVITFPEGTDEKVKVATLPTSISNYTRLPLVIGNQTSTYTGGLYSLSTSNIGYYDVTNKKIFINSLSSNTIAAKTVNGTTSISSPSGKFTILDISKTITTDTIKPTKIEGCDTLSVTTATIGTAYIDRLASGGIYFDDLGFTYGTEHKFEGIGEETTVKTSGGQTHDGVLLYRKQQTKKGLGNHDKFKDHKMCLIYISYKKAATNIGYSDFTQENLNYLDTRVKDEKASANDIGNPVRVNNTDNEYYGRGMGLPFSGLYTRYDVQGDNVYFEIIGVGGGLSNGDIVHTCVIYYD